MILTHDMNGNVLQEEDVVWYTGKLHMITTLDDGGFVFIESINEDGWICPVDWVHCSRVCKLTNEEHEHWFCPPSKQGQTGLPAVVLSEICLDDTPEMKERIRAAFEQAGQALRDNIIHQAWNKPVSLSSGSYEIQMPPNAAWKSLEQRTVMGEWVVITHKWPEFQGDNDHDH